jgi:hypothetical protein
MNTFEIILDFKLSPCPECCILPFGWFLGVCVWIQTPGNYPNRKNTNFEIDSFTFKIVVYQGIISFLLTDVPERDVRGIITLRAASNKCVTSCLVSKPVREIVKSYYWLRRVCPFVHPSVRLSIHPSVRPSACNSSAHTGRIFMKFDIWGFFENLLAIFKFH